MSRPRLTKEQKQIRKELIRYHRDLDKRNRPKLGFKMGVWAIIVALAINELIGGKD